MLKKPLVLIGLPGAGKTVTGRRIAQLLKVSYVDADQAVEAYLGQSIRSYFETRGEQAFRDVETQILLELLQKHTQVIAAGGGVVLRPANREALTTQARVIFLNASVEEIFCRLQGDQQRPLLQVEDPLTRLHNLKRDRDDLYRETAHMVVNVDQQTVDELAEWIIEQLRSNGDLI